MNFEDLSYEELLKRYSLGYLTQNADSAYSRTTLEDGARIDLDEFLSEVEETANERGFERGLDDSCDAHERELRKLTEETKELRAKAAAGQAPVIRAIATYIVANVMKAEVSPDDVEAWAYQDGWNDAMNNLMAQIEAIKDKE